MIPEGVRTQYGWDSGMSFAVFGHADAIILQPIVKPDMTRFDRLLSASRRAAREAGLTPRDVTRAIRSVRLDRKGKTP